MENFTKFDRTNPYQYYQVLEKIGTGGYSDVYKCEDKIEKEFYAMKIMDKQKLDEA